LSEPLTDSLARPFSFMFCISLESLRPVKCQTILDWSATLGDPLLAMTSGCVLFSGISVASCRRRAGIRALCSHMEETGSYREFCPYYSSMHRHKFQLWPTPCCGDSLKLRVQQSGPPHLRPNRNRHGVESRVETNECRPRLHTSQLNAPQFRSPGDIYSARSYLIPTLRGLIQTYPIEACTTAIGRTHLLVCCS